MAEYMTRVEKESTFRSKFHIVVDSVLFWSCNNYVSITFNDSTWNTN